MFFFFSAFSRYLAVKQHHRDRFQYKLRELRKSRLLFNNFEFYNCHLLFNSVTTFLFDALYDRKNCNVIVYLGILVYSKI